MKASDGCFRRSIALSLMLFVTAVPFGGAATGQSQPAQPSAPAKAVPSPSSTIGGDSQLAVPEQQQNNSARPVGTAAAPYEKATGVPASRPAGAVIAPAKQRRVRSFLIKVGVILGAAVAVGTVVALTKGSPSRPQ